MAILKAHIPFLEEAFRIPGLLSDPVLVFGFQDLQMEEERPTVKQRVKRLLAGLGSPDARGALRRELAGDPVPVEPPPEYRDWKHLGEVLERKGFKEVRTLDLFDPRADLRYDMNRPVPASEHERWGCFLDIGSLEHVFDTRQCIENSLRMVRVGGWYLLHTPVNGYFGHGLHVFHPEGLLSALRSNGFEVLHCQFMTQKGLRLDVPIPYEDIVLWAAARKKAPLREFQVPQQELWRDLYRK